MRDDDEEQSAFHPNTHSSIKIGKSSILTAGPAIKDDGGGLPTNLNRGNPNHKISHEASARSSFHYRHSSGKASPKLVTNESIKPLPTSFAL